MPSLRISSSTLTSQNQGGGNKKTERPLGLGNLSKNAIKKRYSCHKFGVSFVLDIIYSYIRRIAFEYLRKNSLYIPGIRPGDETVKYLITQYKNLCDNNLRFNYITVLEDDTLIPSQIRIDRFYHVDCVACDLL